MLRRLTGTLIDAVYLEHRSVTVAIVGNWSGSVDVGDLFGAGDLEAAVQGWEHGKTPDPPGSDSYAIGLLLDKDLTEELKAFRGHPVAVCEPDR